MFWKIIKIVFGLFITAAAAIAFTNIITSNERFNALVVVSLVPSTLMMLAGVYLVIGKEKNK